MLLHGEGISEEPQMKPRLDKSIFVYKEFVLIVPVVTLPLSIFCCSGLSMSIQ